jgi:methylphosphotriester-DNA--protein-cysteine methyltransferase
MEQRKLYTLLDAGGKPYISETPGQYGGHKKLKIYGRLDCPSALRYIAKGQYVQYRVFFADEETAIAAGYRPCGVCMKEAYKKWKDTQA